MNKLIISTAQFETRSGDKDYNLSVIETLTKEAKVKVTLDYDPINQAREFVDKILVSMTIKGDVEVR